MTAKTEHFNPEYDTKLACSCGCGFTVTDPAVFIMLENVRAYFGRPITITSGARCKEHNDKIGGASKSQHLTGKAVDFVVDGVHPRMVANFIEAEPYYSLLGLGVADNFTHVDVRGTNARWTY